jgi:hypothetical protein
MGTPETQNPPSGQSRMHRFMIGDTVAILHGDLNLEDMEAAPLPNTEGKLLGFDNDEQTYLRVNFNASEYPDDFSGPRWNGGELVVTEDEVRRVA